MSSLLIQTVLARNIRETREEGGLSQDELAGRMHALGLPWLRATVGKVETERRAVTAEELLALSAALGVPLSRLVAHDGLIHLHPDGLALEGRELQQGLAAGGPAWPQQTMASMEDWQARYPVDEAVRHAATRLERDPVQVTAKAQALYHRTLTQERDRRVAEADGASSRESQRARRGHVMRTLLAELAEDFERDDTRDAHLLDEATKRAAKRGKAKR